VEQVKKEKVGEDEPTIRRIQDNIARFLDILLSIALIIDGVWLQGVALTTGDTEVAHRLGKRPCRGYIVTKRSANAVVYDGTAAPSDVNRAIVLKASAAVTVDLWVW
jgi:hypothetical protein